MPDPAAVDLSVVVVTLVDLDHLANFLETLGRQNARASYEVIIPCDETVGETGALAARFPEARFFTLSGTRTYAEIRAAGVREARGRFVVVTEDHCLPEPGWVQAIVEEHANEPLAIGGVVRKDAPDKSLNWAVYLLDYVRYSPPADAGETHELTDLNVSYKMNVLREIEEVWKHEFHEPDVHHALTARGGKLWLSPKIVVRQRRNLTVGHALWDRYAFGRLFGSNRIAGVPWVKRLIYAAATPLLPFLLVARVRGHVNRKGRYKSEFVRALPWILILASAWAFGECTGYLTGSAPRRLAPRS